MEVGGSYATYEVIAVDLKTQEIGEAADVLYATVLPGVAASPNRIVACGASPAYTQPLPSLFTQN